MHRRAGRGRTGARRRPGRQPLPVRHGAFTALVRARHNKIALEFSNRSKDVDQETTVGRCRVQGRVVQDFEAGAALCDCLQRIEQVVR